MTGPTSAAMLTACVDEHRIGLIAVIEHECLHSCGLFRLPGGVREDRIEHRPRLHASERDPRGIEAAAPPRRAHLADWNRPLGESFADSARLAPARLAEIALSTAVAELEARGITDTGIRGRVPHHDYVPAVLESSPERFVRADGEGQQKCDEREPRASPLPPHSTTPSFPLWDPMYQSLPFASTTILRMPTFFEGRSTTFISPLFGSKRTTVSVLISFAQTMPAPSTVTAYAPPREPAGRGYSFTILPAAGSSCPSLLVP